MGASCGPRVGLVWACGAWNPQRSIPFPLLKSLLALEGIEFWNLQGDAAALDAHGLPIRDAAAVCGEGLLPLAATIADLDLVITPDTLAAHLAGALGKPAWVMLQYAADWRWMLDREDTPWYPTLRLFRQASQGDWPSVVDAVRNALQEWAARRH
jgi:ADP-heptose:LPS heptosyltransferase